MKNTGLLTAMAILTSAASAQLVPGAAGNSYRRSDNPLYWKNKKPYEGYWQQDVYYQISAKLNDEEETITGEEELVYYNNSPHTLKEAYFHLYQNAVQPGSLVDELYNVNKTEHTFGRYEKENKGTQISAFSVNGQAVAYNIDFTLLKCELPVPLKPGDSCVFRISFKTYFDRGSIRRRMKVYDHHGYKHFNGVHWYPRICVYDRKFTWETSQHMEHEFYGDYGAYDVELRLPNHYINEATGVLQNAAEVYPGDLRQRLDISNFRDKKIGSDPSVVVKPDGTYKSWRYHATNVHDFAWTADPTYRIGEVKWNGISCIALAQENNAAGWQPTAQFVANVVATYSRDFGMYEYPKMVAADAADGMEYPMITLDGGYYPGHQGLIAHEVGHNWFFGMVGNNETYRASLDEGFTQFLTSWSMKKLTSRNKTAIDYSTVYGGYLSDAVDGNDAILSTHSDDFENAIGHGGGYRHVYYKTATMLYNLQYVLGDSVFQRAMKDYVSRWKMCHPYIEDFRASIIMSAETDLNWFFDQWFETTKAADYGVRAKKLKGDKYKITVKRHGDMVMPVDLLIYTKNESAEFYTIPVSQYSKPGSKNLPVWTGWGRLRPEYSFEVTVPGGIKRIFIDPTQRLADIKRTDNYWPRYTSMELDRVNGRDASLLGGYKMQWRPDIWYQPTDGLRAGLKFSGQYAMRRHVTEALLWYNTGLANYFDEQPTDRLAYMVSYSHDIRKRGTISAHSRYLSGLWMHKAGWKFSSGEATWTAGLKYMERRSFGYLEPWGDFPMQAALASADQLWSKGRNISLNLGHRQDYHYFKGKGYLDLQFRTSTPWSDARYGLVTATLINTHTKGKFDLRTRLFAAAGAGDAFPAESAIYLWGANPEEMQDNKYTRDFGCMPLTDLDQANAFLGMAPGLGGGLNLRGYYGYMAPVAVADTVLSFMRGNRAASASAELDFTRLLSFVPKIPMLGAQIYLFGDAGIMGLPYDGGTVWSGLMANAGIGTVISIREWQRMVPGKKPWLNAASPLNIRFDVPFWLSAVQDGQNHLQFRWVLGINSSF